MKIVNCAHKGRGVVAASSYKKGDLVEEAPVVLVPMSQIKESDVLDNYVFFWKQDVYALAFGYGSLYNHDGSPNVKFDQVYDKKIITFQALRDIDIGEELTINYSSEDHCEVIFDDVGGFKFGDKV